MPRNYPGDFQNVYLRAAAAFDITGSGIFMVADSSRKDIIVLNPEKDPIHVFGGKNSGDHQARRPGGLAYGVEGTVYVTDKGKNRVADRPNCHMLTVSLGTLGNAPTASMPAAARPHVVRPAVQKCDKLIWLAP
jgi:hypothetical protein